MHSSAVVRLRVVVISFALAIALPAAADGFVWHAPASCPTAADVRGKIELRLGEPIDGTVHGIEVAVARDGSSFVAHVDTRGLTVANDKRTLTSAHCDELADAVAVVVARLANERRRTSKVTAAIVAGDAVDAPTPEQTTTRVDVIVPRPRVDRRWGGGLRAVAASGIGSVPQVGLGAELAGYVRRRDTFGELALTRWFPRSSYLAAGAPARVDVALDTIAVRGGWGPARMPLRVWAAIEAGSMTGQGVSLHDPQAGAARWFAAGAGLGVGWPMTDYARFVGSFEVVVPIARAVFKLEDGSEIYRPAFAAARCSFGLEIGWR